MVIAVFHRVRALVRAATLLVAPELAEALRDQPAVEEAKAWAAVASAVGDAAVEAAVAAGAEAADKKLWRKREIKTKSLVKRCPKVRPIDMPRRRRRVFLHVTSLYDQI